MKRNIKHFGYSEKSWSVRNFVEKMLNQSWSR